MIEINKINVLFCKDWIAFQTNKWLYIKVNKISKYFRCKSVEEIF